MANGTPAWKMTRQQMRVFQGRTPWTLTVERDIGSPQLGPGLWYWTLYRGQEVIAQGSGGGIRECRMSVWKRFREEVEA